MNITSKTSILVNGRATRVCGRRFNKAVKAYEFAMGRPAVLNVQLPSGERVLPSKGLSWLDVAKQIRKRKQVQAAVKV